MDENKRKVPKIRFPGFTDDWEQRKLLDLLIQPVTDGPHETPELVEEGVPFISVDAIIDNKIDFNRKRGNISEEYDELCCKKYKPQLHDVYLVKSGSTVGKVAIVETTKKFNIWSPLAAMRCGDKTNPYFLYDLLQTKDLQAQVADKASNGTQPNLSMRELEKFPVIVPNNIDEQKKIGAYFSNIDNLITIQQRKLDHLKEQKKGLLQKMFPKKGEKVPEIRFPGFTEPWEQCKLREIADIVSGGTPNTNNSEYWDGDVNWYSPAEIGDEIYVYESQRKITSLGLEKSSAKILPPDKTILFSSRAGIGSMAILKTPAATNQGFQSLVLKNNHNTYFVYSMGTIIKKYAEKVASGSTFLEISGKSLGNMNILIPSSNEQEQIGIFFANLDNLITLQQRKIDHLKEQKKGLLQQMFV